MVKSKLSRRFLRQSETFAAWRKSFRSLVIRFRSQTACVQFCFTFFSLLGGRLSKRHLDWDLFLYTASHHGRKKKKTHIQRSECGAYAIDPAWGSIDLRPRLGARGAKEGFSLSYIHHPTWRCPRLEHLNSLGKRKEREGLSLVHKRRCLSQDEKLVIFTATTQVENFFPFFFQKCFT